MFDLGPPPKFWLPPQPAFIRRADDIRPAMLPGIAPIPVKSAVRDPNFSSVVLLLHCDGADAATSFPDSSASAKSVTVAGNAQVDTAQSKFGGASALFDGSGDRLSCANSTDWNFVTGDFCIEFFMRINSVGSFMGVIAAGGDSNWKVFFDGTNRRLTAKLNSNTITMTTTNAMALSTWHHVALTRASGTVRWFVDGVAEGSISEGGNVNSSGSGMNVGTETLGGGTSFNGWLDEIRITKGVARYTSAFTPPAAAFPNS